MTPHVVVIGDPLLDVYVFGTVAKLSPEAPVPILVPAECAKRAGGALNVASNLSAAKCRVTMIGFTSEDDDASTIETDCEIKRVLIDVPWWRPQVKTRLLSVSGHHLLRCDSPKASDYGNPVENAALIMSKLERYSKTVAAIALADYGHGTVTDVLIESLATLHVPVYLDPHPSRFWSIPAHADVTVKCNAIEYAMMLDRGAPLPRNLVVTNGPNPVQLYEEGIATDTAEVDRETHPVDVCGAGDVFFAYLIASRVRGVPMALALEAAADAATISTQCIGACTVVLPDDVDAQADIIGIGRTYTPPSLPISTE